MKDKKIIGKIYLHTNLVNGKKYVGQTTQDKPEIRWKNVTKISHGYPNTAIGAAIDEYGWDNFKSEILETTEDLSKLNELEEYYINLYNTYTHKGHGYNIKRIIDSRQFQAEETKLKISQSKEGKSVNFPSWNRKPIFIVDNIECKECSRCKQIKPLDQYPNNKRKTQTGKDFPVQKGLYCKKCHNKYRTSHYKYKRKSETEVKESYKNRGKRSSERLKAAYANRPELKEKLSKERSKPIKGVHIKTGEIIRFPSALSANQSGFNNTNLGQAIKHKKPYKGYIWSHDQ